jgi:hypothetical protein
LQLRADYRYEELEQIPGAAELIGHLSGCIWRSPSDFATHLPEHAPTLDFRWRGASTSAGIATLRGHDRLIWVSLLVSGLQREDELLVLGTFQKGLLQELHDSGIEPGFGLCDLSTRPLMASFNVTSPPSPVEQATAALADRCFAAAYFRYLQLV